MSNKKSAGRFVLPSLVIIIAAVVSIGLGFYLGLQKPSPEKAFKNLAVATVLPQPRAITNFALIDNRGNSFTNTNLKGHWTFLFFGFTNCGYICPTTMAELSKVYQILQQNKVAQPQYYLITIDPARDNVKRINAYVTAFNKNFKGATGSQAEIDKLTKALNVVYLKVASKTDPNATDYDIDHSGAIMVVNPEGHLIAFLTMPHNAQKIARDYETIARYYG